MYTEYLELVTTEWLAPFTLQCAALCFCRQNSMDTNCRAQTHFSISVQVEGTYIGIGTMVACSLAYPDLLGTTVL